jgi:hypothetical protein
MIMIIIEIGCAKILGESRGLSRAKALVGPSPKARLGPAQKGSAWPGFRL